jgi:hypothetical protein
MTRDSRPRSVARATSARHHDGRGAQSSAPSAVRLQRDVMVPAAASGSWVIVAAHGGELVPMLPRRNAFGVSNPVFLRR